MAGNLCSKYLSQGQNAKIGKVSISFIFFNPSFIDVINTLYSMNTDIDKQDLLDLLRFEDEGGPCTPSCYMHNDTEE